MKHLMSGNEATARGVYEAGIKICSAYPGTPSTEILENLPPYQKDVYCEWAPNEKVAVEIDVYKRQHRHGVHHRRYGRRHRHRRSPRGGGDRTGTGRPDGGRCLLYTSRCV